MDIIAFIKSLVLDSLGGIPTKVIPFIAIQLITSVIISVLFGKVFDVTSKDLFLLIVSGVVILALSIVASISIPISIKFATLIILWVLKSKQLSQLDSVVFVMIQFLFGSGYVLLGIMSVIVIGVYYMFTRKKA